MFGSGKSFSDSRWPSSHSPVSYTHLDVYKRQPEFKTRDHFQNEIDAFIRCVQKREKLPSHIETVIITAQIMQAIYDSAEQDVYKRQRFLIRL